MALPVQRARAAHGLESVVLGRIVAAGDHDRAVGLQVLRRIIQHRSGNHADVGDIAAGGQEAFDQRVAQARGTEPAIASDVDVRASARARRRYVPKASAKLFNVGAEKFDVGDATDVVLAKDGRIQHTL